MALNTQALLQDRYLLKSILGQGGQATIFRAVDQELKVERAIKALSPDGLRNKSLRERFKAEAQVMAKLEHKGVVRVYDIVYGDRLLFIVMEVLSGGNLWQWVKANGKMPEKMACEALMDVAAALTVVHEKGIVHRDIKPQNMLLNQSGEVKLTDFGIAQFHEESEPDKTMTGLVMGTMGYMSPEQKDDSKQATAKSDIYSLGACLFSLCRARNPKGLYDEENKQELLSGFSEGVRNIIFKACSRNPNDRYGDAAEFCKALEEVKDNLEDMPETLNSLQSQAAKMAAKEDMPIDNDTMNSITMQLNREKTNPTIFFETMVNPSAGTIVETERPTEPTVIETTFRAIESNNRKIIALIGGLGALILLILGFLLYQHFDQDKQQSLAESTQIKSSLKDGQEKNTTDLYRSAKQTCLNWAEKIAASQRKGGGFSGIPQVPPQPWDTGQQLTAIHYGGACGFSSAETWKTAKSQMTIWGQSSTYPRHVFDAAWMLMAVSGKDAAMTTTAVNWLMKYRLKDGSFGVYGTTEETNPYATVLATWALSRVEGETQKANLFRSAKRLMQEMNAPLSAGLDEQAWWVLSQVGEKHEEMRPTQTINLALANRMIDRCKATSDGLCNISNWPESTGSLPTHNGKSESTSFLGAPWALIAAHRLQSEALPDEIKNQLKAIEQWLLKNRLEAAPHMKPGFEMAENLIGLSLLLK